MTCPVRSSAMWMPMRVRFSCQTLRHQYRPLTMSKAVPNSPPTLAVSFSLRRRRQQGRQYGVVEVHSFSLAALRDAEKEMEQLELTSSGSKMEQAGKQASILTAWLYHYGMHAFVCIYKQLAANGGVWWDGELGGGGGIRGGGDGGVHGLSWTGEAAVHVALAVLLVGDEVFGAPPLLAVGRSAGTAPAPAPWCSGSPCTSSGAPPLPHETGGSLLISQNVWAKHFIRNGNRIIERY